MRVRPAVSRLVERCFAPSHPYPVGWWVSPVGPVKTPPYSDGGRWQGSGWAGWSGWTIDDILGSATARLNTSGADVDDWVRGYRPDVVLLHIGSNDIDAGESQERMRDELDELLTKIVTGAPDAEVVVARVANVRGEPNPRISQYNESVSDLVTRRAARGEHVHLVDMESVLDEPSLFADDVHPSAAGYHRMAQVWRAELEVQDSGRG